MVLEDVDSDNEGQQRREEGSKKATAPSSSLAPASPQQPASEPSHSVSMQSQRSNDGKLKAEPCESMTKMSQEDAETQTGRWTPFIESIKREAEDMALATMEER